MAIAKMQKISLVAKSEYKSALLHVLQGLQEVEVSDLTQEDPSSPSLESGETYQETYRWYERSEAVLTLLAQYAPTKPLKVRLKQKRPTLTLSQLYDQVDEQSIKAAIERLESLSKQREEILEKRQKLEKKQAEIGPWKAVTYSPKVLQQARYFAVQLGYLPNDQDHSFYQQLQSIDSVSVEEVFSHKDRMGLVAVMPTSRQEEILEEMKDVGFSPLDYPYEDSPEAVYQALEDQRLALHQEEKTLIQTLKDYTKDLTDFQLASEAFYNQSQRQLVEAFSKDTPYLTYIKAWLTVEDLERVVRSLNQEIGEDHYALIKEEISQEEIDQDEVPIKLENKSWIKPFEPITLMYTTPNYREVDPTPFVMPFYMIFFGMMMGDLGYGLLLWLGTALALKFLDLDDKMRQNLKLGHLLSYPTMIVGICYGSFFGVTLPCQMIDPMSQAMELMIISMGLGFVHLTVGLLIKTVTEWKRRNFEDMYNDGAGWLLLFLGGVLILLAKGLEMPVLASLGKGIAIAAALGIVFVPVIYNKRRMVGFVSGLYNLYGVSSFIGDFVSYSRLMALGLSGGSIAMAFNTMIGQMPPLAKFTIGIVLLGLIHVFNMFLSLLSAYVHGLRLTFVEFFGKFVEGGGKLFQPILILQKYAHITTIDKNVK